MWTLLRETPWLKTPLLAPSEAIISFQDGVGYSFVVRLVLQSKHMSVNPTNGPLFEGGVISPCCAGPLINPHGGAEVKKKTLYCGLCAEPTIYQVTDSTNSWQSEFQIAGRGLKEEWQEFWLSFHYDPFSATTRASLLVDQLRYLFDRWGVIVRSALPETQQWEKLEEVVASLDERFPLATD